MVVMAKEDTKVDELNDGQLSSPAKESRTIVLKDKKIVVQKVQISGLKKTKGDFVADDVKSVLDASTFISAYQTAVECRVKLMQKGIFDKVEIIMDTTSHYEDNKISNGVQVLFRVHEKRSLTGGIRTEMSTNDQPQWVLRLLSPNVFGRGETISATFSRKLGSESLSSHGFYTPSDFNFSAIKPLSSDSLFRISVLKDQEDCTWNSSRLTIRGAEIEYKFPLLNNVHSIAWHGHWRELSSFNRTTAFAVREDFGNSSKSSLVHSVTVDRVDDKILPSNGMLFTMTEELAGLGGDVKSLKENVTASYHKTLFKYVTLAAGFRAGFVLPVDDKITKIPDKFFIGGPMTLRGFEMNCAGPQSDGDFTGGTNYWLAGLHAYLPLPFYWKRFGSGSWLDGFRMHAFVNAGNLVSFNKTEAIRGQLPKLAERIRASYGVGLVYSFMRSARLELNFCVPHLVSVGDKVCDGVQFGIGISSV